MDVAELTALLTAGRSCQEGVGLYRVGFAWVDWYAQRASIVYENGVPRLEPVGPVGWDMSTAVHVDSPTLVMGQTFSGALCQHEVQVLTTGRSDNANIASPRWKFTVEPAGDAQPVATPEPVAVAVQ